jgi:cysteinyl-tRNA synthetase
MSMIILFNEFVTAHPTIDATVLDTAKAAYKAYLTKNLRLLDPELTPSKYQAEVEKVYATVLNGGPLPGNEKPGDDEARNEDAHQDTCIGGKDYCGS